MHILYIVTRGDVIGGASMHVLLLATEMQRRGHRVTVLIGKGDVVVNMAKQRGLHVIAEPTLLRQLAPITDVRCVFRLWQLMRQIRPDVVHLHSAKAGLVGRIAAKLVGLPVIYSVHGWAFSMYEGVASRWFQRIERWLIPLTDLLVLVCRRDLLLAEQLCPAAADRFRLVYNGIESIATQQNDSAAQHECRLLAVARFEEPKDQLTLIRACALLPEHGWRLTFVGAGPLLPACQQLTTELDLPQIEFLGERNDVAALLAQSDVFVLPTKSESLPLSVLEAMRAGLPVIASNVGGVAELVEQGVNGFLVEAENVQDMSERLLSLLNNVELRRRMGQQARLRFEKQFTLRHQCDKIAALYDDVSKALA